MPTYVFRCDRRCATVERHYSMAAVPEAIDCPDCGDAAPRRVRAPALGAGASTAMRLQDATRSSAETPAVVSSVPSAARRRTPVSTNPLHRRLPRP
ncbi:zinc ribbon domain-containing protein [Gordonia sp. L191]|uniref:zinc ribbon domain-containing protein n=1 Tax=Gordonia sp. L191 TaxID=2982699 RepID=UPI0024C0DC48|nr:zinc ribbon domain-containing protein [Gordonia sp. L191]WHU45294.1 zinc ribbon domain-containing protein [Gordonia sp. L191]